jgi:hypothetical protein
MRSPLPQPEPEDEVRLLVEEVLRTGLMLTDLICSLIEDVPEDAFPGERTADVLIEMLTGTVRPAAEAAGVSTVQSARALLGAISDRTIADLVAALDA